MHKFKDFEKAALSAIDYITQLATEEHMSMTKFFGKKLAPALFEGARTGVFKIAGLDKERNKAANERESIRASEMSKELQDALDAFEKLCAAYYESVQDATVYEEKCMYGLRHGNLLCRTNRLYYGWLLSLLKELNSSLDDVPLGDGFDEEECSLNILSTVSIRTKNAIAAKKVEA